MVHKIMVHFIINDILDLIKCKVLRTEGSVSICTCLSKTRHILWNSLAVQWLGLGSFTVEGPGSIPVRGTKIPQAAQRSQPPRQNQKTNEQNGTHPTFQIYSKLFTCYSSFLSTILRGSDYYCHFTYENVGI